MTPSSRIFDQTGRDRRSECSVTRHANVASIPSEDSVGLKM